MFGLRARSVIGLPLVLLFVAALTVPSCVVETVGGCPPGQELTASRCGVGACFVISDVCAGGQLSSECESLPPAAEEVCGNGFDDNCDGRIDEECACAAGSKKSCFSASLIVRNVGECVDGIQECVGSEWGACVGDALPTQELCDTIDNDCDGDVDENCSCDPGKVQSCSNGPADTLGKGGCKAGEQLCTIDRVWDECFGSVLPTPESCNGLDDDCDGEMDDGVGECAMGAERPCYTGPLATENIGVCNRGVQVCDERCLWASVCTGQGAPTMELCNGTDDDCDGIADDKDVDIPQGTPCLTGQSGPCSQGVTFCNANFKLSCKSVLSPVAEVCNGQDDNCDSLFDNGSFCCPDGARNGDETAVDCGGSCGQKCPTGKECVSSLDCISGSCQGGVCAASTCMDSMKTGSETDVDCGGPVCSKCPPGKLCAKFTDCVSGTCSNGICS